MAQIMNEVDVHAFYFAGKDMKSFPRRVSVGNRAITFADGLRVRVERGGRLVYLFNMLADSGDTYRLLQDGNQWSLVEAR